MKSIVIALALSMSAISYAAPTSPEMCQLKINGQTIGSAIMMEENGQGFFAAVHEASQQQGSCLYAKLDRVPNSGRVYSAGQLVPSASGQKKGLSNSEAREAIAAAGQYCQTVSCIPVIDTKQPQYEQPVQVPSFPQAPSQPQSSSSSAE
jgi:hypothetical protein